jgi:hypothetical protein
LLVRIEAVVTRMERVSEYINAVNLKRPVPESLADES